MRVIFDKEIYEQRLHRTHLPKSEMNTSNKNINVIYKLQNNLDIALQKNLK